jgi:hypothetical protein
VPRTGGDPNAPPRQPGEALNSQGRTEAQEAHFRQRIDSATTPEEAAQARYDRNCTTRDNRGDAHLDPADWQASSDRVSANRERGVRLENAALDDAGVPNNNRGTGVDTFDTPDGLQTRPDGVTNNSVIDVKSMPDGAGDDGPRTLYDSDQLRGQRDEATNSGREHVVIMTNDDPSSVRPSSGVTGTPSNPGSTVYHRNSGDGTWSRWNNNPRQGTVGWHPCPRPTL